MEAHAGAALVRGAAELLQLAFRLAALERHVVMLLLAPDIDLHAVGQRVGHRDADAVQAAGGLVDLGVELAAGVQRAHDHFERRLVLEFRMPIDRNASSIALSITSANRWCSAFSSVPPIYMPGRRRTGSSPSSTSMCLAV